MLFGAPWEMLVERIQKQQSEFGQRIMDTMEGAA